MSVNGSDPATSQWHLDKRVNISIIFAIVLQTFAGSYWVGGLASQVAAHDTWIQANNRSDARLSVLEAQLNQMQDTLGRIERRLDVRGAPAPLE